MRYDIGAEARREKVDHAAHDILPMVLAHEQTRKDIVQMENGTPRPRCIELTQDQSKIRRQRSRRSQEEADLETGNGLQRITYPA